ncbi:MAG: 6-hydroxymethylpterin diphosphokinase MptE-like protein [Cyanobacteriota bacterium]
MATSPLQQPSAMEELFPGLASTLKANGQGPERWQQHHGRLFNTETETYLYPDSDQSDWAHEEEQVRAWLKQPDCLQSANTGLLLKVLHDEAQKFQASGFRHLSDLTLATIHDSAQDYQAQWACQELVRYLEDEQLQLSASINNHDDGLLLIYGIGHSPLIAESIARLKPRIVVIFEPDLELLRHRVNQESCEQLLQAMGDRAVDILLVTDQEADLAHLKAKAALESINLFCQEKIFRFQFRPLELFSELDHRFGNGDSMLRDLRYQGFFTDELHMMLNASITFTQAPPRTIQHGQLPAHERHAVICASGPSLDAQLTLLTHHRAQFDLFSCFSTIGTLLQAGLKPDYHCNQERHYCDVPLLQQPPIADVVAETLLLCSANNDPRMNQLYGDVVAFFRSASCASALLAPNRQACISGEGPQVANMALQFAVLLGYRTIHLFGVDLGSADPGQPRSPGAIAHSPRILDRPVAGNRRERVWADQELIESAQYMAWLINGSVLPDAKPLPDQTESNSSDGQRNAGPVPAPADS